MNIFTHSTLKIIAVLFMCLDHIYTYIGLTTGIHVPIWFGYLGKLSAPIFFYLIVEGFYHTRSRKNYLKRLFGIGLLMIGVDLVLDIHNNIFLSLGLGVVMMCFIERVKQSKEKRVGKILNIIAATLAGIMILFTEGSIFALGMFFIFYFLREKKMVMTLSYIVFSLVWLVPAIGENFLEQAFLSDYQWMMVFAIIPIWAYNGKLGLSNKYMKWIFYWFYPIHLILLVSLGNVISHTNPAFPLEVNEQLMKEIVHKIDGDITYKTNTKFQVSLNNGDKGFQSVYLVELYEGDTKLEMASEIVQITKRADTIQKVLKVLPSASLSQGKYYILTVKDLQTDEVLFEDQLLLK